MSNAGPSTIRPSHHALSSHSVFFPPTSPQLEDEWELVDNPAGPSIGQKSHRVVTRDKDLVIAFGSELRITSLGGREWKVEDGKVGSYSLLKSPNLSFNLQQLSVNPTGRLLAAVGRSQVIVVVLPRASVGVTSGSIQCRSLVIDEHLYNASSLSVITKVDWHPWGESGQSLWILTSDGKLREYDLRRPDDPIQTFSFLPTPISSPSRSRLTAIDPLSQYATSFAFQSTDSDVGCVMVYVLTANGDIYTMGPIVPFRMEIPLESLQRLKLQFDTVGGHGREWVEDLVKQAQAGKGVPSANGAPSPSPGGMLREGSTDSMLGSTLDQPPEGYVRLRPPHLTASGGPAPGHHRPLLRQGPLVFSPGPPDEDDDDDVASDLTWAITGDPGEPVLVLAWSDGRVDVGVAAEPLVPRWLSSRDATTDSPSIAILESVKLDVLRKEDTSHPTQTPSITLDSVHKSRLLVQYPSAVYSIHLHSQDSQPTAARADSFIDGVSRLAISSSPFIGSIIFTDIILGYTALATTAFGRALAIERELDSSAPDRPSSPVSSAKQPLPEDPSLLTAQLDYNNLIRLTQPRTDVTATTRSMSSGKTFQTVSAEQLHKSGQIIDALQEQARALNMASRILEQRFDLCIRESQRQFQLLKNCRDDLEALRDSKAAPRAVRLLDVQVNLAKRLETVLETLTSVHRTGDPEADRRWVDEMKRIEMEVGDAESGGLSGRMNSLRDKLATLKATLATAKDQLNSDPGPEQSQVNGLEAEVKDRSEEIRKLMRRMEGLSMRIDAAAEGRS